MLVQRGEGQHNDSNVLVEIDSKRCVKAKATDTIIGCCGEIRQNVADIFVGDFK